MNRKIIQRVRLIVPFLLVAFLVCGSGLFCPMTESPAGTHHSPSKSHQLPPTPINSSDDCLDQFKNAEIQSKDLTYDVFSLLQFKGLDNIFESPFSNYLFTSIAPQTSSYPLLFLLFSVFLN